MKNKSICFFTVSHPMYRLGGAEIQSYLFAKEFANQKWKVFFITEDKGKPSYQFDNSKIRIVKYKKSKLFLITWVDVLYKLLKIDAGIYYYRFHKYHLGLIYYVKFILKKKYVWAPMHDDYCMKDAAIKSQIPLISSYHGIYRILFSMKLIIEKSLFNIGVKHSDLIIAQNNLQKKKIINSYNKFAKVIYNGSNPTERNNKNKMEQIVYIGSFRDMKRPELFCNISNSFNYNYRFLLIGANYENEKKANDFLKIAYDSNITYLGAVSLSETNNILMNSKILVNTSFSEGFPNTFIQAWWRGVPVVSLKVDPDGLIEKNKLGYVCGDDINTAVKAIYNLMDDKLLWREYSDRCYNYAKRNFNIKNTTKIMSNIFNKL